MRCELGAVWNACSSSSCSSGESFGSEVSGLFETPFERQGPVGSSISRADTNLRRARTLVAYNVLRWCESGTALFVNNHIGILIHRGLQLNAALRKNKRAVDKDLVLDVPDGERSRRRLCLGLEKGGWGRHAGSLVGGERFTVAQDEGRGKDQEEKAVFDHWTVQVKKMPNRRSRILLPSMNFWWG